MKINNDLKKFILYTGASTIAMIVDLALFILFAEIILRNMNDSISIFIATIIARVTSSTINFILSKKAFQSKNLKKIAILKFFAIIIVQLLLSAGIVIAIRYFIKIPKTVIKCIVDTMLYFLFYFVNKRFVFQVKQFDTNISAC